VNVSKFIAVLSLRTQNEEYNNPLGSFATCLDSQRSEYERTAISPLHDTRTVKLTLMQCQCLIGK